MSRRNRSGRLSQFAGRFTLEDVESVCTLDDLPAADVLDLLSSLVDKSLVVREDAKGRACYLLHETMREYAALRLRSAGDHETIERRCVEYYRSRCRRSAVEARSRLLEWLEWMDLEIDNVRSVLRRCLDRQEFAIGIDLASSLGWCWITRATTEDVRWLELLAPEGPGPNGHPHAYFMRGFLAVLQVDPAAARPALQRAAAAARQEQRLSLLSQCLSTASIAENVAGDRASAKRLLNEARSLAIGRDHLIASLTLLQAQALNGFFEGDIEDARSASSEAARLSREVGEEPEPRRRHRTRPRRAGPPVP